LAADERVRLLIETPLLLAVTVPRKLHNWSFETQPHAAVMPTLIGGKTNAPAT
jgi:hypothetical protein